jgi:hypothetical protein
MPRRICSRDWYISYTALPECNGKAMAILDDRVSIQAYMTCDCPVWVNKMIAGRESSREKRGHELPTSPSGSKPIMSRSRMPEPRRIRNGDRVIL